LRIIVRSPDAREARLAQEKLEAAGIRAAAIGGDGPAPEGEDLVIVDASDRRQSGLMDFARALAQAPAKPLAVLAAAPWGRPPPTELDWAGPFDSWIALDAGPELLRRQLQAAARVGAAEEELRRRRLTAAELGCAGGEAPRRRRLKGLYIGAPSPFFLALERLFAQRQGLVTAAFSSFSGFDHLHDEFFDAVVLNGAADPATAIALCAALRRNASLHHIPTLVTIKADDEATRAAAIERGAVAVVGEDAPCDDAIAWLMDAIRRERRRLDAEHELRALRDRMGDAATGLFTAQAFCAHVARLAEDHHLTGRKLSLIALRVMPAHGARTPSEGQWRKARTDVAALAARLIRDQDCGALTAEDVILVALPCTALAGARRTAERIASVVECTSFAAGEGEVGPLVFERSTAELNPGESGRGLVARATDALTAEGQAA
jgi:two-component system cell cycle response regulator PopA